MIRKAILILLWAGMLFAAMGCRTVEGLGEDISSLGRAVGEAVGAE